jgi:hypothetical protein
MRGCAWLTGIDRHALHVPCTSRLGSLAKPYLRWSLQGPGAFTLVIFGIGFVLQQCLSLLQRVIACPEAQEAWAC